MQLAKMAVAAAINKQNSRKCEEKVKKSQHFRNSFNCHQKPSRERKENTLKLLETPGKGGECDLIKKV